MLSWLCCVHAPSSIFFSMAQSRHRGLPGNDWPNDLASRHDNLCPQSRWYGYAVSLRVARTGSGRRIWWEGPPGHRRGSKPKYGISQVAVQIELSVCSVAMPCCASSKVVCTALDKTKWWNGRPDHRRESNLKMRNSQLNDILFRSRCVATTGRCKPKSI